MHKKLKTTIGNNRKLTYAQAIHEAIDLCLKMDPNVFVIGEGVPDPKGIFGTTLGLREKYGKMRVMDMPISENGITGICIGAALQGMRPIMTHQRMDFSLLAFDQIANVAAKWYYMLGGKVSVPLVVRLIVGRGWGQGAQHSQSLQALYTHIPGLKVVMPTTAYDVKGLLIAAVFDKNPVIFIEHRWLYNLPDVVPEGSYKVNIGQAKIIQKGHDITIAATSYMVVESMKAIEILKKIGVKVELIDLRTLKPLDKSIILKSIRKTGRLLVADTGWKTLGFASEVITLAAQDGYKYLHQAPVRVTLPDLPTPTSWKLAEKYYPTALTIIERVLQMIGFRQSKINDICHKYNMERKIRSDVPDTSFKGPF